MHSSDGLSGVESRTADASSRGPGSSGLRLLPSPVPLDYYELRGVIAEGTAAVVYLGWDRTLRVPVAIREYMPHGLAWRDATFRVLPLSPAQEMPFARGLESFIDEARTLARCDHPSLLRIVRLLEANGTAYSVMPHYVGRRLTDVRRDAKAAFDEQQLRALLTELLGALEAFHVFGSGHGGVSPDNILLLQNGRPVLLRPRAQSRGSAGGPMDTLAGYMNHRSVPEAPSADSATGPWTDLRDAARVIRFLMAEGRAGHQSPDAGAGGPSREGADATSATRPHAHYSRSLLEALDAAESLLPERRPRSVGEFREWLNDPPTPEPAVTRTWRHDGAAPADEVSVRQSQENTVAAVALASEAPEFLSPERGPGPREEPDFGPAPAEPGIATAAAPLQTPATAGPAERDAPAETVDREIPSRARSRRDLRTRRMAFRSAVALGLLAVAAVGTWLLNRPPVAIEGWSRALAPPSVTPSRNAPNSVAVAAPTLPEAASQAASSTLESGGAFTGTAPDGAPRAALAAGDLAANRPPLPSPTTPAPAATVPDYTAVLPQPGDAHAVSSPVAPPASPAPAIAPRVAQSPPNQGSPREFCAPRTQFALYRCMQTQCRQPRWSQHAECIRLRVTGEVD